MRRPRLLLALVAVITIGTIIGACHRGRGAGSCGIPFTDRGDVRVFVVGHHFLLDDARTYQTFEASFRRHMEQIAPCRSSDRPNLVLFPEDAGLLSWFIGTRAETARHADESQGAFYNIFGEYSAQAAYYSQQFPSISAPRSLTLALGDTAWRAMTRTFGGIAKDYGVWVIAGANLPVATRVTDEATVAALGDPDLHGSDGAWIAQSADCFNSAILWKPDGSIGGRVDKVYLTDPEEQVLDLSNGSLAGLSVLDTPFARIGVAISRDAFYPPFLQRMEDLGADFVVQPEAWSGWTLEVHPGSWEPDTILASSWSAAQKYRGFRYSATPMLTGNLFELYFDGQTWLGEKASSTSTANGFVGSRTLPGWIGIGPWAYPDPLESNPALTLAERQTMLRDEGNKLAPGSGDPAENQYVDSVIGADLVFAAPNAPTPTPIPATAAQPIGAGFDPAVAGDPALPGAFVATWSDGSAIRFAASEDGGATWSAAQPIDAGASGRRTRPSIARCGSDVVVAWQDERGAFPQIYWARGSQSGSAWTFAPASAVEATSAGQLDPALSACGPAGNVALVWADFREGVAPKARLSVAAAAAGGWTASARVDATNPIVDKVAGSQVQPSVQWGTTAPVVAWLDYRARDWRVWATATTSGSYAVTASSGEEVLASDPALGYANDGALFLTWEENRARKGLPDVWAASISSAGVLAPAHVFSGGIESGTFAPRYRPVPVNRGNRTEVVSQFPPGIFAMIEGTAGTPLQLDGSSAYGMHVTRPRAPVMRSSQPIPQVVLWEDDDVLESGAARVYALPLP